MAAFLTKKKPALEENLIQIEGQVAYFNVT